jgi:hypothetical protein
MSVHLTQNGKVEHIIRSVNNVIRTLLFQTNLPGCYWAEGLHTTTYLLNRLPTKTIQAACPHMALFSSPPSYEHLRVFGYTCYPNTSSTTPHKLSLRSTRCVFLGYSSDRKGYHCLDLSTNRLIISRPVVFDEASFPLAASPHLTDLDFLCESGSSVNPIRTPPHHCRYYYCGDLPARPSGPPGLRAPGDPPARPGCPSGVSAQGGLTDFGRATRGTGLHRRAACGPDIDCRTSRGPDVLFRALRGL